MDHLTLVSISPGLLRQYEVDPNTDPRILRITVRNLLHHSTGWDQKIIGDPLMHRELPNQDDQSVKSTPRLNTQEDIVRYTLKQPLQFTPGKIIVITMMTAII